MSTRKTIKKKTPPAELAPLSEMFPDWDTEELQNLLSEHHSDVEVVIDLIVNGKVSRWEPSRKEKKKKEEEPKKKAPTHKKRPIKKVEKITTKEKEKEKEKEIGKDKIEKIEKIEDKIDEEKIDKFVAPVNSWAAALAADKKKVKSREKREKKRDEAPQPDAQQVDTQPEPTPETNHIEEERPVLKEAAVPAPQQGSWASAITPKAKARELKAEVVLPEGSDVNSVGVSFGSMNVAEDEEEEIKQEESQEQPEQPIEQAEQPIEQPTEQPQQPTQPTQPSQHSQPLPSHPAPVKEMQTASEIGQMGQIGQNIQSIQTNDNQAQSAPQAPQVAHQQGAQTGPSSQVVPEEHPHPGMPVATPGAPGPHPVPGSYDYYQFAQPQLGQTVPSQYGYPGVDYSAYNTTLGVASPAASHASHTSYPYNQEATASPVVNPSSLQQQVPYPYPYYNMYYGAPMYNQSGFPQQSQSQSQQQQQQQQQGQAQAQAQAQVQNLSQPSQYYNSQANTRFPTYSYPPQPSFPPQGEEKSGSQPYPQSSFGQPMMPQYGGYQQYPQYGYQDSQYRGWY